jgi:hypothetical protein
MSSSRETYVRPAVYKFDYQVDARVTLAAPCKDFLSASGPSVGGCRIEVGGPACADITPS